MIYKPKYFKAEELVPPAVMHDLADDALMVFDPAILYALDTIRERLGKPIDVNDWHRNGSFSQRGFRTDRATGAKYSQHRFGHAIDFVVRDMSADSVRAWIRKHQDDPAIMNITRIEVGVPWVHIDCAPVAGLVEFGRESI